MIAAIGEAITRDSPILEKLSGNILSSSLGIWASRLPRLQSLELWNGKALSEGAEDIIAVHCPSFKALSIYQWYVYFKICVGINDSDTLEIRTNGPMAGPVESS